MPPREPRKIRGIPCSINDFVAELHLDAGNVYDQLGNLSAGLPKCRRAYLSRGTKLVFPSVRENMGVVSGRSHCWRSFCCCPKRPNRLSGGLAHWRLHGSPRATSAPRRNHDAVRIVFLSDQWA